MADSKTLSRRDVAKYLGAAAGLSVLDANAADTPTPAQVEGPFHPITKHPDTDFDMTVVDGGRERALGDHVLVRGVVTDTDGKLLEGATVDIWQANHFGRYSHPDDKSDAPLDPNFQGWSLLTTGDDGVYGIRTIMPGPYPLVYLGFEGWRCRHIHFKVSCPGHESVTTQMYFAGDPWIAHDEEIVKAPEEERHRLIASAVPDEDSGLPLYRFDVALAKS